MVCGNKEIGEYSVWKVNPSFKAIVLTVILTFRVYFALGRVDFFVFLIIEIMLFAHSNIFQLSSRKP